MPQNSISAQLSNLQQLVADLEAIENGGKKAISNTIKDVKARAPGWIAQEVTAVYNIKKSEITPSGSGKPKKMAGSIQITGETIEELAITYKGRLLTPVHFGMTPKAPPRGKSYTLKAQVLKGQKKVYEGVDIYPDVSVHRCYHDMYAEKQSDELLLKLNDTRELWDSWNPKKGDTIAIEDGAAKTGKMFVESVVPESGIITLRAYSVPQSAKDKRSKSWEKVKFLQLAQEIAGRHSLTLETYGITDQTYDYVEQNNLADFAFFQNRCTLEGAAFLVYDGKLVVYDEAYMESQQPVDTITITPANDFEYRDEGANAYGSAEAVNGGLTGTFAAPNGGDKVLRRILPFRMTDQSEADRFAKGLLRDANKNATVGTLWTGSLLRDYAAGSVVTLATEGVKSWDGTAFISRIRHDYVKTRSKLYLRKPLEGY